MAIAAHLDMCGACRLELARIDSHAHTDFDIGAPPPSRSRAAPPATSSGEVSAGDSPTVESLPASLTGLKVGGWRSSGRGVRTAPVEGAAGLGESVHMLKARPGAFLPRARPGFILVLGGGLHADALSYQAGDFLQLAGPDEVRFRADAATGFHGLIVGDDELYRRPLRDWLRALWGG